MNPRRRTGAWLVAIGGVGIVATVVMIAAYVANVESRVGDLKPVLVLRQDVEPYQPVTGEMVELRRVPTRWLPETSLSSPAALADMVAVGPLQQGSFLQQGMLVHDQVVGPRQRKISLRVGPDPVDAGDVARGDEVVVYGTFTSNGINRDTCLTMLAPSAWVDNVGEVPDNAIDGARVSVIVHKRYAPDLLYASSAAEEVQVVPLAPGAKIEKPRKTNCGPRGLDGRKRIADRGESARGTGDRAARRRDSHAGDKQKAKKRHRKRGAPSRRAS